MSSFSLFTSIKPPATADELSYLRDCLKSWRAAGFDAVAVNGPSEIATLHKLDLPVDFSATPTDSKPRIGAVLSAIRETGARFAGIINSDCVINSDCILRNRNFAHHLPAWLSSRLALAWRVDIDGTEAKAWPWGFDAFFFDTRITPIDDCGFSIGETWWDLWFPLACEANGATVETLDMPLLMHRVHPQNWSWQQWEDNGRRLWTWSGKPGTPSVTELQALSADIPAKLHARRASPAVLPGRGLSDRELQLVSSLSGVGFSRRPPSRNAKCPCGSGLRYKHCCGKLSHAPELDGARSSPDGSRSR